MMSLLVKSIKTCCCCCKFAARSRGEEIGTKEEDKVEAPMELQRHFSSLGEVNENEIDLAQGTGTSSIREDAVTKRATVNPALNEVKISTRGGESSSVISSSQHCLKLSSSSLHIDDDDIVRQTYSKVVPVSQPPSLMRSPQFCDCEPCQQARRIVWRNRFTFKASAKDTHATFDGDEQW
eukprot:jgi/Bigna1/130970/aug1.13_g5678